MRNRVVRVATVTVSVALVGYALSDHPFYGGPPGFGGAQKAIAGLGLAVGATAWLPLEWNKRVLLSLMSLLFMLAVVETGMQAMLAPRYRPPFEYDARYIFKLRPNSYSEHTRFEVNGGDRILSRVNDAGFRGEELQPDDGHLRIVVYGDSFIHAPYCRLEDTFPKQLELALEDKLRAPIEVVNAGVSSYGPDQISLRIEDELRELSPDLVVVALFAGNDYGDLLRNKLFRMDDGGELHRNRFRLVQEVRDAFEVSAKESILKRAVRQARASLEPSAAAQFGAGVADRDLAMVEFWLQEARREFENFVVQRDDVVTNVYNDWYSADVSLMPQSDSARYRVRLMEAVLRRIKHTAERASVPLALLLIPHPMDVAPNYDTARVDRARFPDYRPRNLTDPLADIAVRHDLPFVDLFDAYRSRDAIELYFRGGDDHWNEAGQRLAAQVMADYLVGNALVGVPDS